MKTLFKAKIFIGSFLLTYFLFSFLSMNVMNAGVGVGTVHYGFPFTYFSSYCLARTYSYWGLMGNILFAKLLGVFVGLSCSLFWLKVIPPILAKVSSSEFRQKWYL